MNLSKSLNSTSPKDHFGMEKHTSDLKLKYQHISDEARHQIVTRFFVEKHKLIDVTPFYIIIIISQLTIN